MSYKRTSPMPIIEGGTNATSMATVDGTGYYDGTRIVVTATGTAGQVLTSNGAGVAPTYQNAPAGGKGWLATVGQPASSVFVLSATGGIRWISIYGTAADSTQANNEFIAPAAGTASALYVMVTANASTGNVTITLNKNGVNTALVATITATTTGTFSDLAHSVSIAQGDTLQWEVSQATTGNVTGNISMRFG